MFFDNMDDPRKQALLTMGLGLLSGRGGKGFGGFMRDVGGAGLLGMNAYGQAQAMNDRRSQEAQERELRAMQMAQMKQAQDYQRNYDSLASKYFQPGVQPNTPFDDEGNPMPSSAPRADLMGFAQALPSLGGQGVKDAITLRQSFAKDNAFGKVDPKDYTAESVKRFQAGGGQDYSVLVPVRKKEVVDGVVFDPFSAKDGGLIFGPQSRVIPTGNGGLAFNPALINPVDAANFNLSRAKAADEGVANLPGFMTGGVTGPIIRGPGAAPRSAPVAAPGAPIAAPRSAPIAAPGATMQPPAQAPAQTPVAPGLSPKQQREIAFDTAKQRAMSEEKAQRGGSEVLTLLTQAEKILPGATGSPGGRAVDYIVRGFGGSTEGDRATARLQTISARLISQMPRMEGPQSDRDVEMYHRAAGDLGNPFVPNDVRMAALQTIRELYQKYDPNGGQTPVRSGTGNPAAKSGNGQWKYLGTAG